jgi:hypothetical protein
MKEVTLPRGIRNNNPGNLVKTSIPWQGKVPHSQNNDSRFEQFVSMAYGVRAMMLDVINDINKGLNTIQKLVYEYAPPHENDTQAYINSVVKQSGIGKEDLLIPVKDTMQKLIMAKIKHENGMGITPEQFEEAWSLLPKNKKLK